MIGPCTDSAQKRGEAQIKYLLLKMELVRKDEGFNGLYSFGLSKTSQILRHLRIFWKLLFPKHSKTKGHSFACCCKGTSGKRLGSIDKKDGERGLWEGLQDLEQGVVLWAKAGNRKEDISGILLIETSKNISVKE